MENEYFIREEDHLIREIWLTELPDNQMDFRVKATNPDAGTQLELAGVAIGKMGGIELREDEQGEAHPVREYWYDEEGVRMCIAVDLRAKDLVWIVESDGTPSQPGCRLGGEGALMPPVAG